jgi:ryanodine receptor 2
LPISSGNIRIKNTGYAFGGEVLRLFHGNMDQCFTLPQPGVSEHPYSVFYEAGSVCSHARSLWRLEFLRTRWYSGFMNHNSYVRLRHITSGRYLGVINGEISVIHRDKANADAITFILTPTKDDKRSTDADTEETMGQPIIKYGDTLVYMQHVKTGWWLSYQTYETKKRGVGKVEEKKAALHAEGHMDDCFTLVRAQDEEARSALVIRKCMSLFSKFIRAMDVQNDSYIQTRYWKKISLEKVLKCLDDLIEFFSQPSEDISHDERQNKLKALRNRQDLFHEEGMISLVLETIDKFSETKNQANKTNIQLFDGVKQQVIDDIYDQLYALLATMIKGNRNNCAQFAQGNRLDCLISRLTSQQTSRGVLEVLHCVLIDSPEALNMIKERHIQGIISLLDRNGRDPKVLKILCSLCANNGIAVRTNQNLICENLLPRKDLLVQTRLIDQISCLRPNIMVSVQHGESMYKKWYFEVEIDYIEGTTEGYQPHLRIGWATTEFQPAPDSAEGTTSVGVGDDAYSFGFDGYSLWFGKYCFLTFYLKKII